MQLRNTDTEYGLVTKALHWALFALVTFQFVGGMADIDRDVHASLGILLLVLVMVRWSWRMLVALPDWAPALSSRERRIVHLYELVIYAMLFTKPLTGLLLLAAGDEDVHIFGAWELSLGTGESGSGRGRGRGRGGENRGDEDASEDGSLEGLEDLFESLHFWSGVVLILAIILHVGLVLHHQLILKDGLLRRMTFRRGS